MGTWEHGDMGTWNMNPEIPGSTGHGHMFHGNMDMDGAWGAYSIKHYPDQTV
jgi:hypothetical protein